MEILYFDCQDFISTFTEILCFDYSISISTFAEILCFDYSILISTFGDENGHIDHIDFCRLYIDRVSGLCSVALRIVNCRNAFATFCCTLYSRNPLKLSFWKLRKAFRFLPLTHWGGVCSISKYDKSILRAILRRYRYREWKNDISTKHYKKILLWA